MPTTLITTETSVPVPSALDPLLTATVRARADLRREYVSAGGFGFVLQYARALPLYIDDVTRDLGYDLYNRMRRNPQVESALSLMIMAILDNGVKFPSPLEKDDPDYDLSAEIAAFTEQTLLNLPTPILDTLYEMLLGIAYGYKVAELVFAIKDGFDQTPHERLVLTAIKPRPQNATAFVVDQFNNLLGLIYLHPGGQLPALSSIVTPSQALADPQTTQNGNPLLLSPEKFFIFSFRTENGDWRGTSLLRPAYHPYWMQMQIYKSWLAFLATFAQPSVIGFVDPLSQVDEDSTLSPEELMLAQLENIQNGSCAAFPGGAKVSILEAKNTGAPYLDALEQTNKEITKVILGQTLMTEEGKHMSRSAASTHQDVFGILVRHVKLSLAARFRASVIRPLVAYNWGEAVAERMCPLVSLGQTEHQDFPLNAHAVAELANVDFWDSSQYEPLDNFLGAPARDPASWRARLSREQTLVAMLGSDQIGAGPPGAAGPGGGTPPATASGTGGAGSGSGTMNSDYAALLARTVAKKAALKQAAALGSQGVA